MDNLDSFILIEALRNPKIPHTVRKLSTAQVTTMLHVTAVATTVSAHDQYSADKHESTPYRKQELNSAQRVQSYQLQPAVLLSAWWPGQLCNTLGERGYHAVTTGCAEAANFKNPLG
eukprot:6463807-Amphidinium_carterae.1